MKLTLVLCTSILTMMSFSGVSSSQAHAYRITGNVHSATSGEPIPQAHLTAILGDFKPCPGIPYSSVEVDANPQGEFSVVLPCSGNWRLSASAPGYSEQNYQQHETFYTGIVLNAAHPTFAAKFNLCPPATVNGLILDEAGEPVRSARVMLLDATQTAAQLQPHPNSVTVSDDRGFYEFAHVPPGSYLIGVQAQPWYAMGLQAELRNDSTDPSLDLTYPLTFYPSVTDVRSATALVVEAGKSQEADVHLSPVPAIHLVIPAGDRPQRTQPGNRANNVPRSIPMVSLLTPFGPESISPTSTINNPDGSVELSGFAPGEYKVLQNSFGRGPSEESSLVLTKESGRTVTLAGGETAAHFAQPNLRVTGTTTFNSTPAAGAMILLVAATPLDAAGHLKVLRAQSNTDGSFTLNRIPVGKYILVSILDGWSLGWTDPAILSTFLIKGTPLQLNSSATLPHPIAAQSATP